MFSRKGVDSANGAMASPMVDGRPWPLPIPAGRYPTPTRYRDVRGRFAALVRDLGRGEVRPGAPCHLDPDLDAAALPRAPGWRGALGQCGAARSHLAARGVGPGDLFLFFGLFRPAARRDGRWRWAGRPVHALYGWLAVGEVVALGADGSHAAERWPWLAAHPHARPGWRACNTLYVAADRLALPGADLPGWGVLARAHVLTAPDARGWGEWAAPAWLDPAAGGTGLTYHPPARWRGPGRLATAPIGQEFVAHAGARADAAAWVARVLGAPSQA